MNYHQALRGKAAKRHPFYYKGLIVLLFVKSAQSGNVLFLILIAIALFAALSYAITHSSSGSGSVSKDKANIQASQILDYMATIQVAVDRLRMTRGLQPYQIRYEQDASKREDGTYADGPIGSPADPSIYLFHPKGGGVAAQVFASTAPLQGVGEAWAPGNPIVFVSPIPGIGTGKADIVLAISSPNYATCQAINAKEGVSTGTGVNIYWSPTVDHTAPPATMSAWSGNTTVIDSISGHKDFCLFQSANTASFFHVIAAY